ncbi:MAG: hypothetical protein ACYC9S_08625 [Leptospirales bacterium]
MSCFQGRFLRVLLVVAGLIVLSVCERVGEPLALADPLTYELMGGESIFSQNSWYYYGQVGLFSPLDLGILNHTASERPDVGTAGTDTPTLHLFLGISDFVYLTSSVLSPRNVNTYVGLNPSAGIRWPTRLGFLEGDVGLALANAYQPFSPVQRMIGLFLEGEVYQKMGPGALDLFGNYTGYIAFGYLQARYLLPVWEGKNFSVFAGPEDIGEFSYNYWAGQGGAAIGVLIPSLGSYVTFDSGILRSSAGNGAGGYEGFSWYVSF